jgi:hypothetical protein
VASLLALLALVTLAIKSVIEWRHEREMKAAAVVPPERPSGLDKPGTVRPELVEGSLEKAQDRLRQAQPERIVEKPS